MDTIFQTGSVPIADAAKVYGKDKGEKYEHNDKT